MCGASLRLLQATRVNASATGRLAALFHVSVFVKQLEHFQARLHYNRLFGYPMEPVRYIMFFLLALV